LEKKKVSLKNNVLEQKKEDGRRGLTGGGPSATLGHAVHVYDVARVHLQVLDSSVPSNNDYITTVPVKWQDSQAIINRNFPEAVATGALPNNGMQPTYQLNLDKNETEKVFEFKHASFEEMLKSVVGTYLELVDRK
jgi:nucleoside-diphosphate-sugar epimerase